jgi:hypothetical protein
MLKAAFTITSLLFVYASARSQGTVDFNNYQFIGGTAVVDAPFFDDHGVRLTGPEYVAQLYVWKPGAGFVAQGEPVPFITNGYYFQDELVMLDFVPCGRPVWVQVRAWRVVGGNSFEEAASSGDWTGVSDIVLLPHTGCPGAPPSAPDPLIGLTYPGAPLVVRQPQSQTVLLGGFATLSVIASTGVAASYQWYQQPSAKTGRPDRRRYEQLVHDGSADQYNHLLGQRQQFRRRGAQ